MTTTDQPPRSTLPPELIREGERLEELAADARATAELNQTPHAGIVVTAHELERVGRLLRTAGDVVRQAELTLGELFAQPTDPAKLERLEGCLRRVDGEEVFGEFSWVTGGWDAAESDGGSLEAVGYELCTFVVIPQGRRLYQDGRHVTAMGLLEAERERQRDEEGWTDAHDDEHPAGALATAGECYLRAARTVRAGELLDTEPPSSWPWAHDWWKPGRHDPQRNYERAGALYMAEADRWNRAGDTSAMVLALEAVRGIADELEGWLLEGEVTP